MSSTNGGPLIDIEHLKVFFPIKQGFLVDREVARVHAVNDVTLSIGEGETVGLVGESGCGKTTMSRAILRLIDATEGHLRFHGDDITHAGRKQLEPLRREMQMVFQDPFASLNPRKRVVQIIGQPLQLHGTSRDKVEDRVRALLRLVGLAPEHLNRYPHEFSGGQRQRIGVARALALEPRLIVLDEPVSALDVSVQAQIINLLDDLQEEFGLTYMFVAHDLSVVRHVSDRIAVVFRQLLAPVVVGELYTKSIHLSRRPPVGDADTGSREVRGRVRLVVSGGRPTPDGPTERLRLPSPLPARHRNWREMATAGALSQRPHRSLCHHPLNVSAEEIQGAVKDPASPLTAGDELPSPSEASTSAPNA